MSSLSANSRLLSVLDGTLVVEIGRLGPKTVREWVTACMCAGTLPKLGGFEHESIFPHKVSLIFYTEVMLDCQPPLLMIFVRLNAAIVRRINLHRLWATFIALELPYPLRWVDEN